MRRLAHVFGALAALSIVAVPGLGQTVEIELIIEAFDGAGCIPLDPPNCPAPHDLDGLGCNAHDGSTNNAAPECGTAGGWPSNYSNKSFFGEKKLDQDWWNAGAGVDYEGSNSVMNGSPPENQGSQFFDFNGGTTFGQIESANMGYISPEDPQDEVGGWGRMLIEQIRQEYNTNHPDAPKAPPIAGLDVWFAFDVLRVGDGFGGTDPENPRLKMRADLIAVDYLPVPGTLNWTWAADSTRYIPNDGTWHTYRIGFFDDWPEKVYMGIGIQLDATGYFGTPMTEDVTVYIDNVRVIYEALPEDEVCNDGADNDADGLTDCDDPDCDGDPACPCNRTLFADADFDLDVDQADFAVFQICFTGSNFAGTLTPECDCFDVTGPGDTEDGSIDQQDLGAFEACASGPSILAIDTCDD